MGHKFTVEDNAEISLQIRFMSKINIANVRFFVWAMNMVEKSKIIFEELDRFFNRKTELNPVSECYYLHT